MVLCISPAFSFVVILVVVVVVMMVVEVLLQGRVVVVHCAAQRLNWGLVYIPPTLVPPPPFILRCLFWYSPKKIDRGYG